ncbi:MAG TPA: hypothetical protein VI078_14865 [bacterium]
MKSSSDGTSKKRVSHGSPPRFLSHGMATMPRASAMMSPMVESLFAEIDPICDVYTSTAY